MAEKHRFRSLVVSSVVASIALLAAPAGMTPLWASSPDRPQMMNKKPTMKAPTTPEAARPASPITTETPTTLDGYIDYVSNKLQAEAMQVRQQGSADVKLTIDRSGAVQLAEVVRVNGPNALRDEVMRMVNLMGSLPPLPPNANVDVLVLTSTVMFNYPGRDMFDRYGERAAMRR